jgi:mannose-1-phosphate guanylyltransferase
MHIVLLSGGSGKRLWPLSNDSRSKQFLKVLADENGNRQSMAQRVFSQIKAVLPDTEITIATNVSQVDSIYSQLGDSVNVVIEPERRDTFPAIALACAYLECQKNANSDDTVIVLPVDPYTELGFFRIFPMLDKAVQNNVAEIGLIGIKPLIPTSKYGYIVPEKDLGDNAFSVSRFVEKPSEEVAADLIDGGAYWNGGVFAFKLKYVTEKVKQECSYNSYTDLYEKYGSLQKISFDYKIVEKAEKIAVLPFYGSWSDIGTWRTLTDKMPVSSAGNVIEENTKNTYITNELETPLIALGTKDLIISATPDGILVSDLIESSKLKTAVDKIENIRPMFEERRWGEYTVISQNDNSLVKRLNLKKGKSISYQSHKFRDEIWVITSGSGEFILDDEKQNLNVGDTVKIIRGQKHKISATTDLSITEVQIGEVLSETDIVRYQEKF